jgi:hypothetical protein
MKIVEEGKAFVWLWSFFFFFLFFCGCSPGDAPKPIFITYAPSPPCEKSEFGHTQICRDLGVSVNLGNVGQEVEDTTGVTPLVVVWKKSSVKGRWKVDSDCTYTTKQA